MVLVVLGDVGGVGWGRGLAFFRGSSPASLASERGERRFMGMAANLAGVWVCVCVCLSVLSYE